MPKNFWIIITVVIGHIIYSGNHAYAQQSSEKCSQIPYSNPGKGRPPYRVERIEGQALFAFVSQKEEMLTGGICLVLFNEEDKKPVATITTNDNGQFELSEVAPGTYTLIASVENEKLKKIVLPIRIDSSAAKARQGFLLHLRSKEDSRNSYVTIIRNQELREELLQLAKLDQSVRIGKDVDHRDQAIQEKMRSIDTSNLSRLKEILQKYGWPGPGLVGNDGAEAAFLIVQHADYAFQKKMLPQIRREYLAGRLPGSNYALLLDRVLVNEGKAQIYGTQVKHIEQWNGNEPVLKPIRDEANVDIRRAKLHMPPLSEYREFLKKMYFPVQKK